MTVLSKTTHCVKQLTRGNNLRLCRFISPSFLGRTLHPSYRHIATGREQVKCQMSTGICKTERYEVDTFVGNWLEESKTGKSVVASGSPKKADVIHSYMTFGRMGQIWILKMGFIGKDPNTKRERMLNTSVSHVQPNGSNAACRFIRVAPVELLLLQYPVEVMSQEMMHTTANMIGNYLHWAYVAVLVLSKTTHYVKQLARGNNLRLCRLIPPSPLGRALHPSYLHTAADGEHVKYQMPTGISKSEKHELDKFVGNWLEESKTGRSVFASDSPKLAKAIKSYMIFVRKGKIWSWKVGSVGNDPDVHHEFMLNTSFGHIEPNGSIVSCRFSQVGDQLQLIQRAVDMPMITYTTLARVDGDIMYWETTQENWITVKARYQRVAEIPVETRPDFRGARYQAFRK